MNIRIRLSESSPFGYDQEMFRGNYGNSITHPLNKIILNGLKQKHSDQFTRIRETMLSSADVSVEDPIPLGIRGIRPCPFLV